MKSVILPGVGSVTICDDAIVTEADIENNFFVDVEDKGKKRGECVMKNLQDLNDLSNVKFIDKSMNQIKEDVEFIKQFDIIVCVNQKHSDVVKLSLLTDYPVIEAMVNGYMGYVKIYYKSHVIFDNGDESSQMDLRITHPFPSLLKFFKEHNIANVEKSERKHIPFPVIIYWALEMWRKEVNKEDAIPNTSDEKKRLKEIIKSQSVSLFYEENYDEAYKYAYYAWQPVPSSVLSLFKDERTTCDITKFNKIDAEFWGFVGGAKVFYDKNGRLPISPELKDMIASSQLYTQLQQIYSDQM